MFTSADFSYIGLCLEGFLFGKISILCGLTCTLSKEVRLFSDLGVYSGIFVMYLQCSLRDSESRARTAKIIFYLLCLLYVLSMATVVGDILNFILQIFVSNNSIFYQLCSNVSLHHLLRFKIPVTQRNLALRHSKS